MQPCSDIQPELLPLHQGQLAARDADRIQAHIGRCVTCSRAYEEIVATWSALSEDREVAPPQKVRDSILSYAVGAVTPVAAPSRLLRWL